MIRPNLLALAAVGFGILAAVWWQVGPAAWLWGCWGILILILGSLWCYAPVVTGWLILGCLVSLAGFNFSYWRDTYRSQLRYNGLFTGKLLTVEGRLTGRVEPIQRGVRFELVLKKYRNTPRGKLTIYTKGSVSDTWWGRELRVTGKLRPVRRNRQIWPDFYELRQISGIFIASQPPVLIDQPLRRVVVRNWALQLKLKMTMVARRSMSKLNCQILQAMLFGNWLNEEGPAGTVVADLRRTGTIHLLSVSGLHVGLVVAGLNTLLSWFGMRRAGRIPIVFLGVGFYILMTGMEAPVLRSGVMLFLYILAGLFKTKDGPLNRLTLSALIMLLAKPYYLFEIGFQLSFGATAGVVGIYPALKEYFPVKNPIFKPLVQTLLISVAAQLMMLPLLIYYFAQISWVAPLANLLLAIPASVVVVAGLAGELLGLLLPGVARLILAGVDRVISFSLQVNGFCSRLPWAVSVVPRWPWPWIPGYYLGLGLLVSGLRPNLLTGRRCFNYGSLVLMGLLALNLLVWSSFYSKTQGGYLEVAFIDVGQGDAVFLRTPDHYTVLVDGGDEGQGRRRVVPYLRQRGISRLDQVFGSHGHQDHLGGLDEVLQQIPAGILFLPETPQPATSQLLRKVRRLKIKKRLASHGLKLRWGRYVSARVFKLPEASDENDRSTVLLVGYGKYRLLLTGDLSREGEEILIEKYPQLLKATVLKAGHHGSNSATTWRWLSQVKPRVTVISAGAGNRFGHPGKRTLNRLRSLGTAVYRTDRQGTIAVRIYPDRILVIPEQNKVAQDEAG
ncbi:MAG TPA: DNA internalization-related competence protein ComEC/Rec2 [Bacillota bacterium]